MGCDVKFLFIFLYIKWFMRRPELGKQTYKFLKIHENQPPYLKPMCQFHSDETKN